jgi:hypothetical protein
MSNLPRDFPRNMCAYCGSSANLTDDHVPPKNLFEKPRPSNLISVPACSKCHSQTPKDDEYFRIKICLRDDTGGHPDVRANWDSIFRSLRRQQAAGLRSLVLGDIRHVQLQTPAGLHIGRRLAYDVDMNRIRRVVERTVRGLYFAESHSPLGLGNEVRIYSNEDIETQPSDILEELKETIIAPIMTIMPKVIGDSVFLYRHQIMNDNPMFSVWAVSFYKQVPFLAITGPKG